MKLHETFFWAACFFLAGVFAASIAAGFGDPYLITAAIVLLAASGFFLRKKRLMAAFSLIMILGAGYYFVSDKIGETDGLFFGEKVGFTGIVLEAEQRLESQKLIIETENQSGRKIKLQIATTRYPAYEYGDKIQIKGVIKEPQEEWKNYFSKEGVSGLLAYPEITLISQNHGSSLKAALFKIKSFFEASFKKVLPYGQAVFMSGLTLGETAEFSDDFKEKMRLTGTTHLVALSGYNISIIIKYVGGLFAAWWFSRKLSLPISILVVSGFVVMTGAEPSVVRAAIMAMILLLADKVRRVAYMPNVIVGAALIMILINPRILAFDVGFQLSFLALIGIIYLEPWLRKKLKAKNEPGFLGWRSHFWSTTSAQLAVLPIIIYHFGFVSPVSILTNVLLLEFIPITMGFGFAIGFAALANYWLSWTIALMAQVFLAYELTVIDIFSKIINIF